MTRERASIFGDGEEQDDGLDVTGFKPKPSVRPDAAEVRRVAEADGFTSRQPEPAAHRPPQRRHRTGRDRQLNIKCSAEYLERFNAIGDTLSLKQVEVFERAIEALEANLAR